jgi:hypothetical protein
MKELKIIASNNLNEAQEIIEELKIVEICKEFKCNAHLVGSVAIGLVMDDLNIDFHIYPEEFSIDKVYSLIGKIAVNENITETEYYNFLNTDDKTLDWHLHYLNTNGNKWLIDMIFIRQDSPYIGKAESIINKLNEKITEADKETILKLKQERHKNKLELRGMEIYKAVMEHKIETIEELIKWKNSKEHESIDLWEIEI